MTSDQGNSSLLKTIFALTGGQSQANVNNLTVFLGNGYPSANFVLNKFSVSRNNATLSDNSNNWFN